MKKSMKGCTCAKIAWALVIIGALNWLLIGIFNWNLVDAIFGNLAWLERLIYILVGLSGVVLIMSCRCSTCKGSKKGTCDAGDMKCGDCGEDSCACPSDDESMMDKAMDKMEDIKDKVEDIVEDVKEKAEDMIDGDEE